MSVIVNARCWCGHTLREHLGPVTDGSEFARCGSCSRCGEFGHGPIELPDRPGDADVWR